MAVAQSPHHMPNYILHSDSDNSESYVIQDVHTLPELLRWQAERHGDATLLSFRPHQHSDLTSISYAEAYTRSSALACALSSQLPDSSPANPVVGIWLERSIDLHLAILATTISGAAWLPFDADVPTERVRACLHDSDAAVLLCDEAHREAAIQAVEGCPGCRVVTFEELSAQAKHTSAITVDGRGPQPEDTAYIIYTSGSSGTPKGIAISHHAALMFCLSERTILATGPDDIVWQGFSAAFDMFIEETWVSIAGGAHLAIGSRRECQDVPGLGGATGVWAQRRVTVVNAVPTLINIMTSLDEDCRLPPLIRLLNLGGEACPLALVDRLWSPNLRLLNTYGPSETTVTATFTDLVPEQAVTIGKPLPGYHALLLPVLDELPTSWHPLEIKEGIEGELAIGGQCLGKGYVGRPALTQEKFINHPLASYAGERLYRTGDRVRLDRNLDIVFLGRIDAQVKHRGFRIELGEIEQAIAAHPEVQTAAVILSSATSRLEAYIVAKDGANVEVRGIRNVLRHLPAYMQPEAFLFIRAEELPRLPSGKINARALQDISSQHALTHATGDEKDQITSAGGLIDDDSDLGLLLKTMADVFPHSDNLTTKDDFFTDLGCHSLLAATLVSRLRKESPTGSILKHLGLQDIYVHRTAEKIVASLKDKISDEKQEVISESKDMQLPTFSTDRWPVSQRRYILCSIAQIPALFLLFFIAALSLIGPYLVFYALLQLYDIGTAIAGAYFTFVAIPILKAMLAIVGKWVVLGKARPGEYPLYGQYYYRWWLADQFIKLIDMVTIADTAILPAMLRCLGAEIGQGCHMGIVYIGAAIDLVSIGDDVCLGKDIILSTSWVERGRLILKEVHIGSESNIDSHCVIEGGATVEETAEIGPLSMVPNGARIPMGERWAGSPARFQAKVQHVGLMKATRPSAIRVTCMTLAVAMSSAFILPILLFGPQIPSMMLFDYLNIPNIGPWTQTTIVVVPAAVAYLLLTYFELLVLRWLVLGKVAEYSYRTTSVYWYRKWLVGRLMDMSLVILHPIYATLYVVPFLRSLGVKIGRRAEVSTARGINFELTEIGDESFVADHVLIGNETVRYHTVTLKKTVLKDRAFVGNAALVHQGCELASNTLVGVLSTTPEAPLKQGQSCFGSPPILMPARQQAQTAHAEHLLFRPHGSQIALRLFIEGTRILLPRFVITSALGFGTLIIGHIYDHLGITASIFMLPLVYLFVFGIPSFLTTLFSKLILIRRYHPAEWPLWSADVWKSEFVTSTYETLTVALFLDMLTGTPYLAFFLRLLGVQVGSRATLLSTDITEFDMVSIGDEAVLNMHAAGQTHLFEDRVMKVGRVDVEANACCKPYSICLPNSRVGEGGQLGSLSLLMKGEAVPVNESWEGAPIAPVRRRDCEASL
ncbi:hypothetical protein H2200_006824 [Cladophialophora chaetospira]|uniref:Carrier domain-containing protein n=1 Tax=Cladophialophora chaetospira TaxID=386627 RepID=A0AA38X8Y1_9EURO|nr:hypothetical protein H2200_006824 [Cladophialophora chaetospira]